jgi:hypothetical protein
VSAQPTRWVEEAIEHETEPTDVMLAPDASRTLLEWALERAGAELVTGVVLVVTAGCGPDFLLMPGGQMREVSREVVADSNVAARIVAARRTAGLPLEQDAAESALAPGRLSAVNHQPDLPAGTRSRAFVGEWRPYEVNGGFMAHHHERDIFDSCNSYDTFTQAWPRCWFLNEIAPDGGLIGDPIPAPARVAEED